VVVEGDCEIGERTVIHPFATIGTAPQDLKYRGGHTKLTIGRDNVLREYVNVNRGTEHGGGQTRVGDGNLIMAYSHLAHDCIIGNNTILANAATLAGHVTIEDWATVGAFSGVHQFCRIGFHAFVGGYSVVTKDALPYMKTVGNRARVYGVNSIGLRRRGIDEHSIQQIRSAYRILCQSHLNTTQALVRMREQLAGHEHVDRLIRFIERSKRGVVKR
jgi:UDP-N-acetylglucosamine acyltransferase